MDPAGWYIKNTLWWVRGNVGMILLTHFESMFPSHISKNTKKHLRQSIQEWKTAFKKFQGIWLKAVFHKIYLVHC